MIAGALDAIAALAFTAALVAAFRAVLGEPARLPRGPGGFLIAAMLIMTFVSVSNALQHLGITGALDPWEDYVEVPFLPLLVYAMYGLYARTRAEDLDRGRAIIARLDRRLADSLEELGEQRLDILQSLCAAVDARDHYTALHSMHVADYACAMACRLGMEDRVLVFEQAGLLHDVGKIGVSDTLLLKPTGLTDEEYGIIKRHVVAGANILQAMPFLSEVVGIVRHHHERWDGTGYPDGLAGEAIPLAARMLAVADAFDAMTTDRPYRAAFSVADARQMLLDGRGTQWDPDPVDTLVGLLDERVIVVSPSAAAA